MTRPASTNPDGSAAARQWLETGRLLGVPFAPVALAAPAAPHSPPAAGPAPPAAPRTATAAATNDAAAGAFADLPSEPAAALAELADRYERMVAPAVTEHTFTRVVFGEGDPRAALMVVGEAPGAEEDRSGRPFVGPAGQKLDQMLGAIGLDRGEVYIANVLKIRPPGNRTPLRHEVERCGPWLAAQIRAIRPRVILALGGPAAKWLLGSETGITRLRGVWGVWLDPAPPADEPASRVPVLPTFHPAYLLRHYTRETRESMWNDLQAVKARLAEPPPASESTVTGAPASTEMPV